MWTDEWPSEPGWYWFHGWCFDSKWARERAPETHLVEVAQGANCLMCITEGHFLYKSEAEGVWMPADVPTPEAN